MSKRKSRLPGIIITSFLAVIVLAFITLLIYTKLLPTTYMAAIGALLVVLVLIVYLFVRKFRHKVRFWIGTILAILMVAAMAVGSYYIYETVTMLDKITNVNVEVAHVGVYVRQDDAAQNFGETSDYTFGILSTLDRENTDKTVEQLKVQLAKEIEVHEYAGLLEIADGIRNGEVGAIILNQAYLDVIVEMEGYDTLDTEIREITSAKVETVIKKSTPTPKPTKEEAKKVEETGKVITLYISGIDTRGALTAKSRNDVNIIATLNTKTKQVLLLSTPRDYYVPLSISGGVPDKLTHAGIYGVEVSMDTLEMLYDINIDYYFRVNFGGFINIINALGGVEVYSDYSFTGSHNGKYYSEGYNYMTGEDALAFARERYAFSEGDRQRGKNQMHVIEGVIKKALSPDLLMNYASVLDGVQGSFETNVPYDVMAELVRDQLEDGGSWNIVSYSANGTGATKRPYSMSQNAYVMIPDQSTVDKAKELMQQVRDGEVITLE